MAFRSGTVVQNAACNADVQAIDAGSTNTTGRVVFYTGSQPATPQATATGTPLVTVNLNNPSFGSASAGTSTIVASPALTATCVASGTPGWFRITDRDNNAAHDGSVTATGGGGDITFDNTTWASGGVVTLNSGITVSYPM